MKKPRLADQLTPLSCGLNPMFSFRINLPLANRVRKLSKKEKVTMTSIIELCLRQALPELEK